MLAVFLDIETTGLDSKRHFPLDIALQICDTSSKKKLASYQANLKISEEEWKGRDPVSVEINGYTWEKASQGKSSEQVSKEIIEKLNEQGVIRGKAFFICQNPSFDRSFFNKIVDVYTQERLDWPYHWLDLASMYWARLSIDCQEQKKIFPDVVGLSKNSIAKAYGLAEETMPHSAKNGVEHLIRCYEAVLGVQFDL